MKIDFFKYQGTGNDFVMIDNRDLRIRRTDTDLVKFLCDRKFGVGADGLILLQEKTGYDFEMVYFNADGNESTMCGNGGRCITAFAAALGLISETCTFLAIDGPHNARIAANDWVELKMIDVSNIEVGEDYYLLNTGSPHYVIFVEDIDDIKVVENGQAIRYSSRFRKEGVNVNFVEAQPEALSIATYERGVEDETLSCGTGIVASAISYVLKHPERREVAVKTRGGELRVRLDQTADGRFHNLWLCGPAKSVFRGMIEVEKEE